MMKTKQTPRNRTVIISEKGTRVTVKKIKLNVPLYSQE